ncbi:hypothetical protein HYR99_04145 [Candidatus Poribacteria bacterium]|nr:hypothetical protein [Candidatus Poribacteria bacterium]
MKENGAEVEASKQALKQAEQALEEAIKALEKVQKMEPKKSDKTEELPDL